MNIQEKLNKDRLGEAAAYFGSMLCKSDLSKVKEIIVNGDGLSEIVSLITDLHTGSDTRVSHIDGYYYDFDINGVLLKSHIGDGVIIHEIDGNGRIVFDIGDDHTTQYVYNAKGNIINCISTDGNGVVTDMVEYKTVYDNNGNVVEWKSSTGYKVMYKYDGNQIQYSIWSDGGSVGGSLTKYAHSRNKLVRITEGSKVIKYEYDENVMCNCTINDGIVYSISVKLRE